LFVFALDGTYCYVRHTFPFALHTAIRTKMGGKHSRHGDVESNNAGTSGTPDDISVSASPSGGDQPSETIRYAPLLKPKLLGFASVDAEAKFRILPETATAAIHAAVPPAFGERSFRHHDSWFLLYNSRIHGSSFHRMIQLITDRGPTLIVVKDNTSGRIFGGYNEASWSTVANREKEAKSIAASNARAKRNGMDDHVITRPANQASTYFGNEHSFTFRCRPASDESDQAGDPAGVDIYHARPHVNANYMYLFDAHPDDDKVGIGMGGVPPAYFGLFLNRWLEEGVCRGVRCTTFHNPMLSATETWQVGGVEVYALGTETVEELGATEVLPDGKTMVDTGASIRKGQDRHADKMILELNAQHRFYADEDPRCCEEEVAAAAESDAPPSAACTAGVR
jgi:hypothetical protein